LHQHERASPVDVAEGRRLLAEVTSLPWRTAATDDTCVVDADNEEVCALAGNYCSHDEWPQMEARAALIVFAVNNLPALLTAASERDAAVREVERLRADLERASELSVVGLCQFSLDAKHYVLRDIQKLGQKHGADALGSFPKPALASAAPSNGGEG
jgi:hypothetical protein